MKYIVIRYGIRGERLFLTKPESVHHWSPNAAEAQTFTKRDAGARMRVWGEFKPEAIPIGPGQGPAQAVAAKNLDARIAPVTKAYRATKEALEALPAGRMRALALTDLESSYSRAVFAASGLENPIGGDK